jgi:ABC-2 type transport system ATP-binding protein
MLKEKVTIFVSTAYLDEAERCNRVGLMHHGRIVALGSPDEIKGLMKGTILEIRSSDPRRAAARLRECYDTDSVGLFGDRIHLVTGKPQQDAEKAPVILAGAGITLLGVRAIEPSLEDVFISLVSSRGNEAPNHGRP